MNNPLISHIFKLESENGNLLILTQLTIHQFQNNLESAKLNSENAMTIWFSITLPANAKRMGTLLHHNVQMV